MSIHALRFSNVVRCPARPPTQPSHRLLTHPLPRSPRSPRSACSRQQHGTTTNSLGFNYARTLFPADYLHYSGDAANFPYGVYRIFSVSDCVESIALMVQRYYELPESALDRVRVYVV